MTSEVQNHWSNFVIAMHDDGAARTWIAEMRIGMLDKEDSTVAHGDEQGERAERAGCAGRF